MDIKLFDSEIKVMEVLWREGTQSAGQLAKALKEAVNWNRNTTYTVIKKLIDKGAIARFEPNFICEPLIHREEVQQQEAEELIDKLFDGSADLFLSAYLNGKRLSQGEIARLRQIVEHLE